MLLFSHDALSPSASLIQLLLVLACCLNAECSLEIVRLTSQSRNYSEVPSYGASVLALLIVAVFSDTTIVEVRAAASVFILYGYTN